ncbi:RNA pol II accessory factor, Cdc73 family-domain-containing protein [Lipomyces arxii]|uniref:RNA pol II accessory factor, Cdc73 family-domain-containing protein n=1 Tax=Lipomyces arxii TaxID=56418 RepID=UPI0034CD14F2
MADPLLLLRNALASKQLPVMLASSDPSSPPVDDIAKASYLSFPANPDLAPLALSTPTRFVRKQGANSTAGPVDLRAAYFCWQCRDENVAQYIALCGEKDVVNLTFLERASLVTWLEGADDRSEYIVSETTTAETANTAAVAAAATTITQSAAPTDNAQAKAASTFKARSIDPKLEKIYANERVLVNRNTVLRGSKGTDFAYVRKEAYNSFIQRLRGRNSQGVPAARQHGAPSRPGTVASAPSAGPTGKRREPIILLSPSASSLLTMSNIKDFLERGNFVTSPVISSSANIQMLSRTLGRLGQLRFVVVDSSERFKPDYWDRVVAVFTTGQAWQFKSYKWSDPHVLFQKVKGFCVTYAGDPVPENVRSWNVDVVAIDKVHRFRDRETVEGVWDVLEKWMELRGWSGRSRPST